MYLHSRKHQWGKLICCRLVGAGNAQCAQINILRGKLVETLRILFKYVKKGLSCNLFKFSSWRYRNLFKIVPTKKCNKFYTYLAQNFGGRKSIVLNLPIII